MDRWGNTGASASEESASEESASEESTAASGSGDDGTAHSGNDETAHSEPDSDDDQDEDLGDDQLYDTYQQSSRVSHRNPTQSHEHISTSKPLLGGTISRAPVNKTSSTHLVSAQSQLVQLQQPLPASQQITDANQLVTGAQLALQTPARVDQLETNILALIDRRHPGTGHG